MDFSGYMKYIEDSFFQKRDIHPQTTTHSHVRIHTLALVNHITSIPGHPIVTPMTSHAIMLVSYRQHPLASTLQSDLWNPMASPSILRNPCHPHDIPCYNVLISSSTQYLTLCITMPVYMQVLSFWQTKTGMYGRIIGDVLG